jgi:acyl carrier protein
MSPTAPSWEEFTEKVASVGGPEASEIEPGVRLVEDLDLDSLAVIELVVALMNDYGLAMPDGLNAQKWQGLTAGELFESVKQGSLP